MIYTSSSLLIRVKHCKALIVHLMPRVIACCFQCCSVWNDSDSLLIADFLILCILLMFLKIKDLLRGTLVSGTQGSD